MTITSNQRQVIKRCQQSACWFLRSFGKLKHPSAGILPFHPFTYQRNAIRAFRKHRFNCFRKCRQAGVSKISGAFALWFAMFFSNKTILIVSRTDDTAMEFLRDQVLFLFDNLPEWMKDIWKLKGAKWNDHELHFSNGSKIKSLTSHPDVLRSNASSLNIIDEAAFINNMDILWAGGWPTLQHGGNVIVISTCVAPDTIIQTKDGFQRIGDLAPAKYDNYVDGYHVANCDLDVVSSDGRVVKATKFYKRNAEPTKKIKTRLGYELEASLLHRINTLDDYKYVRDLKIGDYIPIRRGNNVFGNNDYLGFVDTGCVSDPSKLHSTSLIVDDITPELAYMLGAITAEGSLSETYVSFVNGDDKLLDVFRNNKLGLKWVDEDRPTHIRCCSTRFVRFLKWFGFKQCRAWDKEIPQRLWSCSREIISAFLRGLYDGDGHSRTINGEVALTSPSRKIIEQTRLFLLNYGIICREEHHNIKEFALNGRVYKSQCRESWQLIIRSGEASKFYDAIGFGLERKATFQENCREIKEYIPAVGLIKKFRSESGLSISSMNSLGIQNSVLFGRPNRPNVTLERRTVVKFLEAVPLRYRTLPSYCKLTEIIDSAIYWDTIESLEDGFSEVMDFTIPETANFWSAGFDSHNTNGVGNWYWSTVTDAEAGINQFNPVTINWWDMDWVIEYTDPLSREHRRIAPRDGLIDCNGKLMRHEKYGDIKLDPIRYGPFWSPWLEDQYRALQEKGEGWKFEQEVLASFVGSGNTVLSKEVLSHIQTTIKEPIHKVRGIQSYVHPSTGAVEELDFDFDEPEEGLWVWEKPVVAAPMKKRGNHVIDYGQPAHSYVMGVDIATGKGRDYSTIVVLDVDTREQVAEFMARCLPREFVRYIDRVGRWYNCALAVVERNNGGDILIDSLRHDVMYPRLWRKKDINDKPRPNHGRLRQRPLKVAPYGFSTSSASKPTLNKYLMDYIRAISEDGYTIFSKRLFKQFQTYVRKRDRSGKDTAKTEAEDGPGNFDDLVIACALSLVGVGDAVSIDAGNLMPLGGDGDFKNQKGPIVMSDMSRVSTQEEFAMRGGPSLLMPISLSPAEIPEISTQRQLDAYTIQLGGIPISQGKPIVTPQKYFFSRE